jgi:hypothetical protein
MQHPTTRRQQWFYAVQEKIAAIERQAAPHDHPDFSKRIQLWPVGDEKQLVKSAVYILHWTKQH